MRGSTIRCTPSRTSRPGGCRGGKKDPLFRTKLQIAADLAARAQAAGVPFRAVAADSAYGDQDGLRADLRKLGAPFMVAVKPRRGTWAYGDQARTPVDAARDLAWNGPGDPGDWHPVTRRFHDGHGEAWWAADATLGWWRPDGTTRLVVATTDPATLPDKATWYLATYPALAAPGKGKARGRRDLREVNAAGVGDPDGTADGPAS